jgi:hypothetical protein
VSTTSQTRPLYRTLPPYNVYLECQLLLHPLCALLNTTITAQFTTYYYQQFDADRKQLAPLYVSRFKTATGFTFIDGVADTF